MTGMRRPARRYTPRRNPQAGTTDSERLTRRYRQIDVRLGALTYGLADPDARKVVEQMRTRAEKLRSWAARIALAEEAHRTLWPLVVESLGCDSARMALGWEPPS